MVKHSLNTQRSSLELERVMLEAGFLEGLFQNLILKTEDIVNVINDGRVRGASVTGSVSAGSAVASEAGRVIKKTLMELGCSDAFIVLEDADSPKAVVAGIKGRFSNAGQVCLAAKRFILVERIADEFEEQFVKAAQALRSATQWIPQPDGAKAATTFATLCTGRWRAALRRVHVCYAVANPMKARVPSTCPRY